MKKINDFDINTFLLNLAQALDREQEELSSYSLEDLECEQEIKASALPNKYICPN